MVAGRDVTLTSAACPGFVEFVERGQTSGDEVTVLAERLLAPVTAADVDALLLGCTHYPFLSRVIGDVVGPHVTLGELRRRDGVQRGASARRARAAARRDRRPARPASLLVERRRRAVPRARPPPARARTRRRSAVASAAGPPIVRPATSWSRAKECCMTRPTAAPTTNCARSRSSATTPRWPTARASCRSGGPGCCARRASTTTCRAGCAARARVG